MTTSYEPEIAADIESVCHDGEMLLAYPQGRFRDFQERPAKVTVCLPVFNAGAALMRCLDSILSQIGADFQVLIVDNSSTDSTFGVACRVAAAHEHVLVLQNAENIGRVPNWNRCLELACGELIKFVMVHDILLPGTLECLARTRLFVREPSGSVHFANEFPMSLVLPSATAVDHSMTQANIVAGPTVQMLRHSVISEFRLRFDSNYAWGADCVLAHQLLLRGDFAYVHEAGIVMNQGAARFHREAQTPLKFHDQLHVILYCFQATGARPEQAEAVVARIQREYENHRTQTEDCTQHSEMEEMYVKMEQCLTINTRLAA
jgi:hypothetical protein